MAHSESCCRNAIAHTAEVKICKSCGHEGADCQLCLDCAGNQGVCSHCRGELKPSGWPTAESEAADQKEYEKISQLCEAVSNDLARATNQNERKALMAKLDVLNRELSALANLERLSR